MMLTGGDTTLKRKSDANIMLKTLVGGEQYGTQAALTTVTADQDKRSSSVGRTISLQKSDTSRTGWQDINL